MFVKIFYLLFKTGYIKESILLTMNLKERGITVGDLIIIIIISTTTIVAKSFNKDKKTTLNISNQEKTSYKEFISKNHLKNFSI